MSNPARTTYRPVPERVATFPVINRHDTEARQRGQIQYLTWRLMMYLKDHGATKRQRQQFSEAVNGVWATGDYDRTCSTIESLMRGFFEANLIQVQAIYNER